MPFYCGYRAILYELQLRIEIIFYAFEIFIYIRTRIRHLLDNHYVTYLLKDIVALWTLFDSQFSTQYDRERLLYYRILSPNSATKINFFSNSLITQVLDVGWSYTLFSGIDAIDWHKIVEKLMNRCWAISVTKVSGKFSSNFSLVLILSNDIFFFLILPFTRKKVPQAQKNLDFISKMVSD